MAEDKTGLRDIREQLGLSQESMSRALDVSARSVERWEATGATSASPEVARRVALVAEIATLADEAYGDDVATFMATPRRSLAMRTPREAVTRGDLEAVREVLIDTLDGHWA